MSIQANIVAAYLDGQPGVAFYGRKAFWSSNINLSEESYLYNDEVPALAEGQVIFLSFAEALDRNDNALRVVAKSQLQLVEGQSASILTNEPSPVLAKCTVDGDTMVGFVYPNPKKFLSHVSRLAYFDRFPEERFSFNTEPNKAYFFSALSMVCNFVEPYVAVSLDSLTLFPSSALSNPSTLVRTAIVPTIASSNTAISSAPRNAPPMGTSKPPLVVRAAPSLITPHVMVGRGGRGSEGGYTTLPSASTITSQESADITDRKAQKPLRFEVKGYLPKKDDWGEMVTRKTREMVGGGVDPQLALLIKEGRTLFSSHWEGLKVSLGWGHSWLKPPPPAAQNDEDIYLPPLTLSSTHPYPRIENVSYFYREHFDLHIALNPSLTMEWGELWPLLQEGGWTSQPCPQGGVDYVWGEFTKANEGWGVHRFKSKLALTQFVARFPYPLQPASRLGDTLERHGWKVDKRAADQGAGKNKDAACFTSPNGKRYAYQEAVKALWSHPALLFCGYPRATLREIEDYLSLPASDALAPDNEPSSPEVERMSNKERYALMAEATQLSRALLSHPSQHQKKAEKRLGSILDKFGWLHAPLPASASPDAQTWWRWEKVYMPPYAPVGGKATWVLGVDFFFHIKDVAVVIRGDGVAEGASASSSNNWGGAATLYLSPLKLPPYKFRNAMFSFAAPTWDLQKRVFDLAYNEKAPFQSHHFREMLADLGWGVGLGGRKEGEVFVPPNGKGLKGKKGVDFLVGEDDVIEYLMRASRELAREQGGDASPTSQSSNSPSPVAANANKASKNASVKAVALFAKNAPAATKNADKEVVGRRVGRPRLSRGGVEWGGLHEFQGEVGEGWESDQGQDDPVEGGSEGQVVNRVKEAKACILNHLETTDRPYLPAILKALEVLRWRVIYSFGGEHANSGFFLTPWGWDKLKKKWEEDGKVADGVGEGAEFIPYAFFKANYVYMDLSPPCPLIPQLDYFLQDYDRLEMCEMLKARGRKRGWRKMKTPGKNGKGKGGVSGSSNKKRKRDEDGGGEDVKKTSKKKKQSPPVVLAPSPSPSSEYSSDCPPDKIVVLREVRKPNPHFGTIVGRLRKLQWKGAWTKRLKVEEGVEVGLGEGNGVNLHIAPWGYDRMKERGTEKSIKVNCVMDGLVEFADFFRDTPDGRDALVRYIRMCGLDTRSMMLAQDKQRELGVLEEGKWGGDREEYRVFHRSPAKALYKSWDVEQNMDRLVTDDDFVSPTVPSPLFRGPETSPLLTPSHLVLALQGKGVPATSHAEEDMDDGEEGFVDTLAEDPVPFSQMASSLYDDDELGDEDIEQILTTPPPHPLDFTSLWRILTEKYSWDFKFNKYCKPNFIKTKKAIKSGKEGVDYFSTKKDLVQYLCHGMGQMTYFNSRLKNML